MKRDSDDAFAAGYSVELAAKDVAGPGSPPWPPDVAIDTEWLLTNGRGGFSMGTVAGINTRRYHSLLIAATHPPVGRIATLSGLHETIRVGEAVYELATHEFASDGGTVFNPQGWRHLRRFDKGLTCTWEFEAGPLRIERELRLIWRRNLAEMRYRIMPATGSIGDFDTRSETVTIELRPLIAMRDFHHLRRAPFGDAGFVVHTHEDAMQLATPDGHTLHMHLHCEDSQFIEQPSWWYNFIRRAEAKRQQDAVEDLFCPGYFEYECPDVSGESCEFVVHFGTEPLDEGAFDADNARLPHLRKMLEHVSKQLDGAAVKKLPGGAATVASLITAADDFVVEREVDGDPMMTILAGYPWFADWGRDTMISLDGLLLTTGRFDEAKRTLITYARHIRNGLIPNRFDDYGGEPHYNTVDASLWFVHAALRYVELSGDKATWKSTLAEACMAIIDAYRRGTDDNIHMDRDGLIAAGDEHSQLTWMDAKRDGVVFTPRHGKAVEINALWHRALVGCGKRIKDPALETLAAKVKRSFNRTFWCDDCGYLIDHVNEHGEDRSLRPNQVLAVSLPNSPLAAKKQQAVMEIVREKLLTPRGLRTLPTDDPNYHRYYSGSMFERDSAYHRGTVWAWLIGPYVEGYLRAYKFSDKAKTHARAALRPLLEELAHDSLGQLHEIFEADPPHRAEGCIAQAWSIAETLRSLVLIESAG